MVTQKLLILSSLPSKQFCLRWMKIARASWVSIENHTVWLRYTLWCCLPYCWWKKSGDHHLECIEPYWYNGRNYQPQPVRRISAINSSFLGPKPSLATIGCVRHVSDSKMIPKVLIFIGKALEKRFIHKSGRVCCQELRFQLSRVEITGQFIQLHVWTSYSHRTHNYLFGLSVWFDVFFGNRDKWDEAHQSSLFQ